VIDVPLNQIDTQEIKRRSLVGVVTLTSRTFILQVIALVATFILTILLTPTVFGIFFVVTAVVNFLNYFSDIGLAAALIQKKDELTRDDLTTTFTIQQLLVSFAVIIALVLSSRVADFYKLGSDGIWLFRALVIAFFLSSLKTIPSVLLERKLDFQKLVIPQIVETLVFYVVAILLALKGEGVRSFAWAAIWRGISGVIVLYLIAPWQPGLALKKESARKLLSFGLPYQANSFLALLKDDLLTIFLGKILPFSAIGYIGWAKKWAEISLRLIMDNVIKVTFPTYSRLQHDSQLLGKAIQKSLLFLSLLTLPIAVGMLFLVKPFILIVPRYSKWEPALFSFYLFTFSAVLAAISSPLVNALNAIGKVKYTFLLMIMWTSLTWVLVPLFVYIYGFNGVAVAAVIISLTSFVPVVFIRKVVRIHFLPELAKIGLATLFMVFTMSVFTLVSPTPQLRFTFSLLAGFSVYAILIYALLGSYLAPYWQLLTRTIKS